MEKELDADLEQTLSLILKDGGIGVLPTDTIYGLVGSALLPETVERIYDLRKRNKEKPMIVLIASLDELSTFDIELTEKQRENLQKIWPGKVSAILDCESDRYAYLHRGQKSLAFRLPETQWLRKFLIKTGPLVAPSANIEGEKPASIIEQAKEYFQDEPDFYLDFGELNGDPSTIIEFDGDEIKILRQGSVKLY
jgi:L-threonylcarbamoyladenylate synthase